MMAHTGSLVRGSLSGGGLVTRYINNPDLDFTGYNAAGMLDLKNAAAKVSQRISLLSVRGTYQSTPAISGFTVATAGAGPGIGAGGALNSGLVTNRTDANRFTIGVVGGYQLTPTTTLSGSYDYTQLTFGNQSGGVNNLLFDTTSHTGTTSISTRVTERDTVGASATMSHFIQEQSSGGSGQGTFTTFSETLNWHRRWTQELTTSLAGGGILTPPVGSSIPGQSVKSQFGPTAAAVMTYTSFSEALRDSGSFMNPFDNVPALAGSLNPGGVMAPGAYTASMRYIYSVFPSYAFGSGPTKAHVVGIDSRMGIMPNLTGLVGINYSHGTRSSPTTTFDSIGANFGATYLIGPVLASLTYNWMYFSNSTAQSPNSQSEYEFSKKIVMLTFSYAFMSPGFFRIGEWGSTGTQGSGEGISAPSGTGTGTSSPGDGSGVLRKE